MHSDSQLVVSQFKSKFEARGETMMKYLNLVIDLHEKMEHFEIYQVLREQNSDADYLVLWQG